jgi:hypothetical protein
MKRGVNYFLFFSNDTLLLDFFIDGLSFDLPTWKAFKSI